MFFVLVKKKKRMSVTTPNELLKCGGTDGRIVGSGLLCDSSRHFSHVTRFTLESGLSASAAGLDMAGTNISRVNELEVEVLRAKRIISSDPVPVPALAPAPAVAPAPAPPFELPDDMVVDNLQSQEIVTSSLVLPKLLSSSCLGTDAEGNVVAVQQPLLPTGPDDQVPRFVSGSLAPSSVKVDSAGNVTGISQLDCFHFTALDSIQTDTLQTNTCNTKTLQVDNRLTWGQRCQEINTTTTLFVSNGAFQPIGMSGEGFYICNLKISDYSIWLQTVVGKTKTIYRSSFGGGIGGIKSTQIEEHESDGGFDFVVMNIPDLAKISFGVEQKTGEFHIRSDQNELISVRLILQKLSLV